MTRNGPTTGKRLWDVSEFERIAFVRCPPSATLDPGVCSLTRFALVIPALNEEDAIASTLTRALNAREKVVAQTHVDEMIVVFVNDGSTDRTQEIVDGPDFNEVVKVRFEKNRGYGAAIKAGWQATDADLVGFIDGDGTCDPDFCVNLLKRMKETDCDVVLAGRLNPQSKMPAVRKLGNKIFAGLLGFVSGEDLTDSASGFRIVKRQSLKLMSPLPDGLHFTPAMSAICLLDPRLKIEEVMMPYEERIGESKLSVIKDGMRFLFTILFAACCYAPIKTMLGLSVMLVVGLGLVAWLASLAGAWSPLPELIALTGGLLVIASLGIGVVTHELNFLLIGPRRAAGPIDKALEAMLHYRRLIYGGVAVATLGGLGLLLTWNHYISLSLPHVLCVLVVVAGGMAALCGVVIRVIWAVGEKQRALIHDEYRVEPDAAAGATADRKTGTAADDAPQSVAGSPQ